MTTSTLYPIALDLRGRRCVVVGGGQVGARRAQGLLDCGACVVVIDPAPATDALPDSAEIICEPFQPQHLDGAFLAVAATNNPSVNAAVADAARARHVLLNLAAGDDSDTGDFVTMGTVRRGSLLVGVTTGGAGPAVTRLLRAQLEQTFPETWAGYLDLLDRCRTTVKREISDSSARADALRALAADVSIRGYALTGNLDGASAAADALLASFCALDAGASEARACRW